MLVGAATIRMTAIVGPPSATEMRDQRGQAGPSEIGQEHHPLAVAPVGDGPGDHPEEEVGQRLERADDAHREARPGQRQDEQRQRREADRVAERRDPLAGQQDPEVSVLGEGDVGRLGERLGGRL